MKFALDIIYLFLLLTGPDASELEAPPVLQQASTEFSAQPVVKEVVPMIREASGIADSHNFPGHLWVHEDSGAPSQLILLSHEGKVSKKVGINMAMNRDWEDMALVNGNIYLADIGDNRQVFERYWFYIFPEPGPKTDVVNDYQTIMFQYPDGSHDAEAFLVDPASKDILIITKRDEFSRLYTLTYPYSDSSLNTVSYVASLPYTGVVSAALSPDAREILVKTYPAVFHYSRQPGQSIAEALEKNANKQLPYQLEPQGEAVCFQKENKGYFSLSEKGFGSQVNLFYYPRK